MTNHLEDELRRTFAAAAGRAPVPPSSLVKQVDRGFRRHRRRRGATVIATVAITAMAAGSTIAAYGPTSAGDRTGVATGAGTEPGVTTGPAREFRKVKVTPKPIKELWPKAVHEMPNRLADGRKYTPEAFVDDDTVLVSTESSFEKVDQLALLSLTTKKVTPVTRVVTPSQVEKSKDRAFASDFTVGDGHVAWWTGYNAGGTSSIQIWTVPLGGGNAKQVVNMKAPIQNQEGGVDGLTIAGGKVIWSIGGIGGVYRAPLTGGPMERYPGTDTRGYHIVTWPWVGKPSPQAVIGSDETGFGTLRNLQTGERLGAKLTPKIHWSCGPTWCVGAPQEGSGSAEAGLPVQRRNGTGHHLLPPDFPDPTAIPGLDRFVVLSTDDAPPGKAPSKSASVVLYDLETGKAGDLDVKPEKDGSLSMRFIMNPANRLYFSDVPGGYLIIDLSAIE